MNTKQFLQALSLAGLILASTNVLQASTPAVTGNIQKADGKTIIRGTIQSNTALHHTPGAHVHVQLADSKGVLLEEIIQRLPAGSPRAEAGRNYRSAYSIISRNKSVSKARSFYVAHPHAECPPQKS